jgi:hypothetical protein
MDDDLFSHFDFSPQYINPSSVDDLFDHYERVGFLYPEKKARILPYIELIKNNWENALSIGEKILWAVIYRDPKFDKTASVSVWRSTSNGWTAQHLTSTGDIPRQCAQ